MKDLLKGLNQHQVSAVKHNKGPLLVIAGAGTGKTTVITRRIAWLITEKKVAPSNILALTFTDKAAGEMEERVDKLVPYGYVDTWISTFHAFCDRILRDNSLSAGLTPNFKVLTQPEEAVFLRERIFALDLDELRPLSDPYKHIPAVIEHFSRLKDDLISPKTYSRFAQEYSVSAKEKEEVSKSLKYLELAKLYENYQDWLRSADSIDFGDQIMLVTELFCNHPELLSKYQKQFKYCLVDEFQDTNIAQNTLLKLLFGQKESQHNIFAVGDDDQSIYQFRGAAVQNIMDFRKNWPESKTIVLNQNYRSVQPILDKAYDLIINNNPERLEIAAQIDKKLIGTGRGSEPEFRMYDDDYFESKSIVEQIISYVEEGDKYGDIAILTRTNNQLDSIIRQLRVARIPFISPSSSGLYDEPIIKLLISFVRTLSNYDDHVSLYYLATSDVYKVDTGAMTAIISFIRYKNISFRNALETINDNGELLQRAGDNAEGINHLVDDIRTYTEFARDHNVGEVIYKWLDESGVLKETLSRAENDINAQVELENIAAFYEKIKNFIRASDNPNIISFNDNLKLLMEAGENPSLMQADTDINAVVLSTIHSAKGLEWPIVFLPSLSDDRFPARHRQEVLPVPEKLSKATGKDIHLQEERRLFYVALTRAKRRLHLSCARKYDNNIRNKKISRFVIEALGAQIKDKVTGSEKSIVEKLSLFDSNLQAPIQNRMSVIKKFTHLNPHQIDDYLTCPKKFEYVHVLKVPIITNWQVIYGVVIHNAIGSYFSSKLQGKTITLDELLKIYQESWKADGFSTHEHEARKKQVGISALIDFYNNQEKSANRVLAVEEPFEFELEGAKIRGRFDTVMSADSDKMIIDFKTSDVKEMKKGIERVKKSTQMQIYALAGEGADGRRPRVALHFVESGIVSEYCFTDKEAEKIKKKILKAAEGINRRDFVATPGVNQCRWCAYKDICPFKYKGA